MISVNILRHKLWLTGREAKALLESEIPKELGVSGKLEDGDFFELIEQQNEWLSVFVEGCEPELGRLTKGKEIDGAVQVSGGFELGNEEGLDEETMGGPPDIIVDLSSVRLDYAVKNGSLVTQMISDCWPPIIVKVFFRKGDILRLAKSINKRSGDSLSDDGVVELEAAKAEIKELRQELEQYKKQKAEEDKGLHPSERKSAGQIIAVLASMASINISKPYAVYDSMGAEAARAGLVFPGSKETLKKFFDWAAQYSKRD